MKYLFWAAFILLLDVSISQEVEVPCATVQDCQNLTNAPEQVTCYSGFCKCLDTNGTPQNCASVNVTGAPLSIGGLIGRICSLDKDCFVTDPNAICNTTRKQCACNTKFVPSTDNMRCLSAIPYNVSGCEISKQCLHLVGNTTCKNGACICEDGYHFAWGSCWATKGFGSDCSVTHECSHVEEAICDNQFRCNCPDTRVAVTRVSAGGDPTTATTACLLKAAKINDDCVESIQCFSVLGEKGVCVDHHCKCHEHYHHSTNASQCVPNLELGAQCQEDNQCLRGEEGADHGPTRCLMNKCACAEGFQDLGGKCQAVDRSAEKSSARRFGDVSIFAMTLAYFGLLSSVL